MKQKFLISGVKPSEGGAGQVLDVLIPLAIQNGFVVIIPKGPRYSSDETRVISSITSSTVVFFHIQTVGFELIRKITSDTTNETRIYVLDSSFFCMRSYNYHGSTYYECLRCLQTPTLAHSSCKPFPVDYSRDENVMFLSWLHENFTKFTFFAQNHSQATLLSIHFGALCKIKVVGLNASSVITAEVDTFRDLNDQSSKVQGKHSYDIVYHGSAELAKGSRYCVELAGELPEFLFLLPFHEQFSTALDRQFRGLSNVIHEPMWWDSGLSDATKSARLVLCPSLWSAPVEGALLKSMAVNGLVGVIEGNYRFCSEIPRDLLLRLPPDPSVAASVVRSELSAPTIDRSKVIEWVKSYIKSVDFSPLFA